MSGDVFNRFVVIGASIIQGQPWKSNSYYHWAKCLRIGGPASRRCQRKQRTSRRDRRDFGAAMEPKFACSPEDEC